MEQTAPTLTLTNLEPKITYLTKIITYNYKIFLDVLMIKQKKNIKKQSHSAAYDNVFHGLLLVYNLRKAIYVKLISFEILLLIEKNVFHNY